MHEQLSLDGSNRSNGIANPPRALMDGWSYDQAYMWWVPKSGYKIRDVRYLYYMTDLPVVGDSLLMAPQHVYLDSSQNNPKAIGAREETVGEDYLTQSWYYEVEDATIYTDLEEWLERAQILDVVNDNVKAWARNDDNTEWVLLGHEDDVTCDGFDHGDFLSEIAYIDTMELPATGYNYVRVLWVGTDDGWKRPYECLQESYVTDGTWARIDTYWDYDLWVLCWSVADE